MEKLKLHTADMAERNIEMLGQMFPNCLTETINADGKLVRAIDFDKLRQELACEVVEGAEERYQFTWPDKRAAVRLANTPTTMTLRPCREESVDFDNTQNLYIEGDNLDVLKVLRETYLGKVKMIYIDPPYNTGNDFVYNDDFTQGKDDFEQSSGLFDEEGNQTIDPMQRNTESNGRFHTDWLNMIYPRLKVARDLLSEDGVIFISIDDNEVENLRKICDEIFGEKNFVANCIRRKNKLVMKGDKTFKSVLEPLIIYSKRKELLHFSYTQKDTSESDFSVISAGYGLKEVTFKAGMLKFRAETGKVEAGEFNSLELLNECDIANYTNTNVVRIRGEFKWSQEKIYEKLESNAYILIKNISNMTPRIYFKTDSAKPLDYIDEKYGKVTNEDGISELKRIGLSTYFSYPKPVDYIKFIGNIINDKDALILDFFSGSATTAHAVMKLNAEDGGNRKFIMVQLPEKTDEKSEAYKAGYKNICEIGKERIRRAGKKVKEEAGLSAQNLDTGFRVLKLDTSNMEDVYYTPQEFELQSLFNENVKADRTNEDLLFQVMLDLGIELSAKIECEQIAGKKVHFVDDNYLVACFDRDVNESTITEIAKLQPIYFVMRDASAANDNVIDNFEQIFKHYSPDTNCRII